MKVTLISTYDLGRQPFGLASPAAWLRRAGAEVVVVDSSRQALRREDVQDASLVAFHLPMHTATRLAVPLIDRVRQWHPDVHLCCYGLYAPLNAGFLRARGVESIMGGEFEQALVDLLQALSPDGAPGPGEGSDIGGAGAVTSRANAALPRLAFLVPEREGLPALGRYASLNMPGGGSKVIGYTEASRGCKHICRHCPVVPVYGGQFRVVAAPVVLADIEAQVAQGAQHITFGDPDFFNGVGHALPIVEALAERFPGLTYDVTIKVEHLLQHAAALPRLRDSGCLFVTTAVESVDDRVLGWLDKGHTRADFIHVVQLCRAHGLTLSPTFVPFTPWTTLEGYCDLLDTIDALDLVAEVAPVQLSIRLLVTEGSRLLELPALARQVDAFDPERLSYPWRHEDKRVDALQREIAGMVGVRLQGERGTVFDAVHALAHERAGLARRNRVRSARASAEVPFVSEPWYCCAEPTEDQLRLV